MFRDLDSMGSDQSLVYEICIVGTGPSGISLATKFNNTKYSIVMLESGGLLPDPKYQTKIIADTCEELRKADRATMLMACASGKTLVSMWIAQKRAPKTIVIFVPSLALAQQFTMNGQERNHLKIF